MKNVTACNKLHLAFANACKRELLAEFSAGHITSEE